MAIPFNPYLKNHKGAKEAGELLAKPFKLEQALYTKVKEHEEQEANLPKSEREKKAVNFFLRCRIRCDKYVKESVAPAKGEDEDLSEEEIQKRDNKRMQDELIAKSRGLKVESIEVTPIKGEIKMAPLTVNCQNNGNTAKPFGSEAASLATSVAWSSVKFSSINESQTPLMVNSLLSNASNSLFDNSERSPGRDYGQSNKRYKPVNFMNFKSKQRVTWKEDGYHQNLGQSNINDVLKQVREREENDKRQAEERQRISSRSASSASSKQPNGVKEIGLSKVGLPYRTGNWRPSNDNWKPGVNTDGFFTALAALNEAKEQNRNKKVVYGEKSYTGATNKAFKDSSLSSALNNL